MQSMVICITMYYTHVSPNYKDTQWCFGRNRWPCVCWWASVIDCDVWRGQGLIAVRPSSTPCGDCPHWTNRTVKWCIHVRFHDTFREDWGCPKWWSLWWGLDPHFRIGRRCRMAALDYLIADLDSLVLVRVRRRIDVATWDWGGDVLQLEGCRFPRSVHVWWISAAMWKGLRHMDGTCWDG